jgi:CheY-like chemotaxis protein
MIVDDDDDIRMALRIVLETFGYCVTTASDGAEALDKLEAGERPCLIILDLMMPGMDGQQFREARSATPRSPRSGRGPVWRLQGRRASGGDGRRGAPQADPAAKLLVKIEQFCGRST